MISILHCLKVGTCADLSVLSGHTDLAQKGDLIAVGCHRTLPGNMEPRQGEKLGKGHGRGTWCWTWRWWYQVAYDEFRLPGRLTAVGKESALRGEALKGRYPASPSGGVRGARLSTAVGHAPWCSMPRAGYGRIWLSGHMLVWRCPGAGGPRFSRASSGTGRAEPGSQGPSHQLSQQQGSQWALGQPQASGTSLRTGTG